MRGVEAVHVISPRSLSAAELKANNPVLSASLVQFESDTGLFKVGNGVSAWNDLPYSDATATQIVAVEFDAWPPSHPSAGVLYLRLAP